MVCKIVWSFLLPAVCAQIAVVRPWATDEETRNLHTLFQQWNTVRPCEAPTKTPIDLFLVYSQPFANNKEAADAAAEIAAGFASRKEPWHQCFRNLQVLSAEVDRLDDIYDPEHSSDNKNWVKGPNAVFRFLLRHFLGGQHAAFFLMEADALPRKSNWLAQLEAEVLAHPTSAIRGSAYRGDRWDSYLRQVDEALLKHVNGNAIYFTHNVLLSWLSVKLHQEEADVSLSGVPYDLRMAQLVMDAMSGRSEDGFQIFKALEANDGIYAADSQLIGNYANTLLNSSFDEGEFIVHNSPLNCFNELNPQDLTLGVVYLDDESATEFEDSLPAAHPFSMVLGLQHWEMQARETRENEGRLLNLQRVQAALSPAQALCEIANLVNTRYFVFMDSDRRLRPSVSVLARGEKPVLPYVQAESALCESKRTCQLGLARAREVFQTSLDRHYELHDTVFSTGRARDFCSSSIMASPEMEGHVPSADDYMAWQLSRRKAGHGKPLQDVYHEVDRSIKSWRGWTQSRGWQFRQSHPERSLSEDDNETNATNSSCADLSADASVCTSARGCEVHMGACRDLVTTTMTTTFNVLLDLSSVESVIANFDNTADIENFLSTTGEAMANRLQQEVQNDPNLPAGWVVRTFLALQYTFKLDLNGLSDTNACTLLKGARSVMCDTVEVCTFPFPSPYDTKTECLNRRLADMVSNFLAAGQSVAVSTRRLQTPTDFRVDIQVLNAAQLPAANPTQGAAFTTAAANAAGLSTTGLSLPAPTQWGQTTKAIVKVQVPTLPDATALQSITAKVNTAVNSVQTILQDALPNQTITLTANACGDRDCNNRGDCDASSGVCTCTGSWEGINCETAMTMDSSTTIMVNVEGGTQQTTVCWVTLLACALLAAAAVHV